MHHLNHFIAAQGIVNKLSVTPRGNQPFPAQDTLVLRKHWLLNTDEGKQLADVMLSFRQLAENQPPVFVRHCF